MPQVGRRPRLVQMVALAKKAAAERKQLVRRIPVRVQTGKTAARARILAKALMERIAATAKILARARMARIAATARIPAREPKVLLRPAAMLPTSTNHDSSDWV
jgi:hypothetical protein